MNPIYSIKQNTISYINNWRNCVVFLILLVFISFNAKAQSFQMMGNPTGIVTLNPSELPLENKTISIGKDADKETNYKIVAAPSKAENCPNKEKLVGLCSSIFMSKKEVEKKKLYYYEYERKILEASCVDKLNDSEDVISKKVNIMWQKYENLLTCTDGNFGVNQGNILKLAVSRRLDSLLEDAVQVWKINPNRVDSSDGFTVLDYVQNEIKAYKGTDNEQGLQYYYKLLRDGGAKHADELKK